MIESSTRKDAGLDVERVESLDISLYGAIYFVGYPMIVSPVLMP
jgi:hypothetical protein